MFDEELKVKAALYAAMALTFIGYGGRYFGMEPVHNQFFVFAAWSYLLFLDNANYRLRGASLFVSRTGEFAALAAGSLVIFSLFELLNLRLGAWHYSSMPSTPAVRWTCRALAWAALLPCVAVTSETLRAARLDAGPAAPKLPLTPKLAKGLYIAGYSLLGLAFAAPRLFWPLAFPALALLAEPLAFRLGLPSLLRDWQAGRTGRTLRLALAGMICGLLWQNWNSAAGAHRLFDAPWAGPSLAGLPAAGFPAAAALALICYPLYGLLARLRGGDSWEEDWWPAPQAPLPAKARLWAAAAAALLCWAAFKAADSAVLAYLGWV